MNFKDLTKDQIKADYSERHGFYFKGVAPCKKESCEKLAKSLIANDLTQVEPDFVVMLNSSEYVFVYPEGASFNAPSFMSRAESVGQFIQMWEVKLLSEYLI